MSFDMQSYKIPSVLMRGGTSRGLIIKDIDLPKDPVIRDKIISKIYGSSKNGQIDGIGGGTSLTSKLAIVGPTTEKGCDIFYTFGQVDITSQKIDYNVTCGNMASAVGLYAVEEGLVPINEGLTTVKILNTNTNQIMTVDVPVKDNQVIVDGDFKISGVSGTGAEIMVNFLDFGGAITGELFPTGHVLDQILLSENQKVDVTILDVGNVLVFVHAHVFGLKGTELLEDINANPKLLNEIEALRVQCGKMLNLFDSNEIIKPSTHALPKIVLISPPQSYVDETGEMVEKEMINIIGRYITMGKLHRAFAVSGSIGLGTACKIPGTLPNQIVRQSNTNTISIGHPSGSIDVKVEISKTKNNYTLIKGGTGRTARRIMEGTSIVPFNSIKE